ncbi:MAG: glycosyltransferase [Gemmatimonadota bacterium]
MPTPPRPPAIQLASMPTRRRIAHFVDTEGYGGAEAVIASLCGEALRRGDEPLLYHFQHDELAARLDEMGVEHHVLPQRDDYKGKKTLPRFSRMLRGRLRAEGVDILHSHLFGPVCAGALATAAHPTRHIGTLHDSYTFADRPNLAHAISFVRALGTQVVAVSESVLEAASPPIRYPFRPATVIRNGIHIPPVPDDDDRAALRADVGVEDPDLVVFVTVARLFPIKGIHVLLDAWARIEDRSRLRLLIIGDGPDHDELLAQRDRLGLQADVDFLGFRRDVSRLLFASDVFVLPSFSEGLSCSVLEAMAHSLPVVASDVGGNPSLVLEGRTGTLVPAGEPTALADALVALARERTEARAMGDAGLTRVQDHYSDQTTFDQYWALYGPS